MMGLSLTLSLVSAQQSVRISAAMWDSTFCVVPHLAAPLRVRLSSTRQQGALHCLRVHSARFPDPATPVASRPRRPRLTTDAFLTDTGADSVVVHDGVILEKPESDAEAAAMMATLSGGQHSVATGVALVVRRGDVVSYKTFVEETVVQFADLSQEEIAAYIQHGDHSDKAGGYGCVACACSPVVGTPFSPPLSPPAPLPVSSVQSRTQW